MKFGVREICDVVFKAKSDMKIGKTTFKAGQPVLYIDTATASSLEQAATTVYAQGGKGNSRLIAWEGEKTLTFTVTDALLSPIGFSILAGAGLFKNDTGTVNVHATTQGIAEEYSGEHVDKTKRCEIELPNVKAISEVDTKYIIAMEYDKEEVGIVYSGDNITVEGFTRADDTPGVKLVVTCADAEAAGNLKGKAIFIDYYIKKDAADVSELQIDAKSFGGYFYVEASTLVRRQDTGVDMPAEITLPNVKIQSNFTFNMSATGDPSTFDFVMDAFPDYTIFNKTKKVLCVIQVVEDAIANESSVDSVMGFATGE